MDKKIIGNYKIEKVIGEGTFSKVKLGIHIPTQQKVAIKILDK
jgi:5'-AMP-activated protein kinase catalytic alpha subunit